MSLLIYIYAKCRSAECRGTPEMSKGKQQKMDEVNFRVRQPKSIERLKVQQAFIIEKNKQIVGSNNSRTEETKKIP